MIYLTANTANQIVRLSLDEARQYYSTPFTHYLFILKHEENSTSGVSLSQVASVVSESQRITTMSITTIPLTLSGRYRYEVYGQNSAVNTNPSDASVVGLCEIGLCVMTDETAYYDLPAITIINDVIYNG
jgi:magnesium-transporting ATPase (P-type)